MLLIKIPVKLPEKLLYQAPQSTAPAWFAVLLIKVPLILPEKLPLIRTAPPLSFALLLINVAFILELVSEFLK